MFLFGSKIQALLPILIQIMHSTEMLSQTLKTKIYTAHQLVRLNASRSESLLRRLPPAVSSPTLTTRVVRFSKKQDLRWYCKRTSLQFRPHACTTQPKVFPTAQILFSTKF